MSCFQKYNKDYPDMFTIISKGVAWSMFSLHPPMYLFTSRKDLIDFFYHKTIFRLKNACYMKR